MDNLQAFRIDSGHRSHAEIALSGLGVACWTHNLVSNEISYSDEWRHMLGFEPAAYQQFLARPLERVHIDDLAELQLRREEIAEGKSDSYQVEYRIRHADESWIWIEERAQVEKDDTGQLLLLKGCNIAISNRKSIQHRERLTEILEATSDYVGIAGKDHNCIWRNERLRSLQATAETSIGKAHPAWALKIQMEEALPHALEHGTWSGESAILDGEGNEIPVSQVIIAHRNPSGEVDCFSTIMRDISDQRDAAKKIRERERIFSSLAAASPVAIARIDRNAVDCNYVNSRWSELTGQPAEAALGEGYLRFIHPEDLQRGWQAFEAFNTDDSQDVMEPHELRHILPDGSYAWALLHLAKERDEHGVVTGYVAQLVDIDKLKRTEQQLRLLHSRFERVLETSSIGIWEWNLGNGVVSWDDQMLQIHGITRDKFRGTHDDWLDRLHPEDRTKLEKFDPTLLNDDGSTDFEFRIVRPDGSVRNIFASVFVEVNDAGDPERMLGINMDITERKQAELALDESQRQFQRITENIPGVIFQFIRRADGTSGLTHVSPRVSEVFGVSQTDALSDIDNLLGVIVPEDHSRLREAVSQSAANLETLIEEYRIVSSTGLRWVQSISQPIRTANGDTVWDGVIFDITARKKTEIALAESQAQFLRMTENVPGMIFRYLRKPDGIHSVIFVSTKSRELFEVSPEEAKEDVECLFRVFHPDDVERVQLAIQESEKTLKPFSQQYRVILPKKGLQWRQTFSQPTRADDGSVIWDGVTVDITFAKQAELQLKKANRELARATQMKDQFLRNMSHELRTPLTAILGMTEGLQHKIFGPTTEEQQNSYDVIQQSGNHLLDLINEILDLAKIESGAIELDISSINVVKLCETSLQLVKQQAAKKSITTRLSLADDLPILHADAKRLKQMLLNLLSNAIKFTPNHGSVSLNVKRVIASERSRSESIWFSVTDTGIGVEASQFEEICKPFVQLESGLSRQYEGSGLGLALVKQLAELHGGSLHIASEIGVGSCFSIELPLRSGLLPNNSAPTPEPSAAEHAVTAATSPSLPSILLVEDNALVAKTTTKYLQASEFRVSLASNGLEVLETAKQAQPNVILMDIQIPGIDGLECIRQLRRLPETASIPIIAMTGLAMEEDAKLCLEAGADHYLSKPCSMKVLVELIQELLAKG